MPAQPGFEAHVSVISGIGMTSQASYSVTYWELEVRISVTSMSADHFSIPVAPHAYETLTM